MGRGCRGRAARGKMRVARREGGRDDSVRGVSSRDGVVWVVE